MTITVVGNISLGAALPAPNTAAASAGASLNVAYPDIDVRVTALTAQIALLGTLPPLPNYTQLIATATDLLAKMQAAAALPGIPPPPSLASSIADLTAELNTLNAEAISITAQLADLTTLLAALAATDVTVYAFDGPRNTLGAEITATINPADGTQAYAMVLVTGTAATWTAMQTVFKTTP